MVQIDVPVAFGIGCLFADAARRQLQSDRPGFFYAALAKNNIYQSIFFSWIPLYFLMNYFGWETTYMWWKKENISAYPFFVPIFVVVFFLAANAGFLLGNRLVRRGKPGTNRAIYLAILGYSAVWILAQTNRTFRVATYQQWKAGNALWFYQDRTFLLMLILSLVVWGAALYVFCRQLLAQGKQLGESSRGRAGA